MSNDNICISGDSENRKLTINIIKCCSKHPPITNSHGDKEEVGLVKEAEQKTGYGCSEDLNGVLFYFMLVFYWYSIWLFFEERGLHRNKHFGNEFEKTNKEKACQASFLESLKVKYDFNEKTQTNQSLNNTRSHPLMEAYSSRDQTFSLTTSERMFPNVPARYHGPGCAMEIEVLEKHHSKCR